MPGWIPARLRSLIGPDLDSVTGEQLAALLGLAEDVDVEWKSVVYAATDGDRKEAAYDLAGFANAGGGLFVFGMAEDGSTGRAQALQPVEASDHDFALWLHQVVAARISPPFRVEHRQLDVDGGVVHLVSVPPSGLAPHAVNVGDGALRYPLRIGSTRHFLTEGQVFDRYVQRATAAQSIRARLDACLVDAAQVRPSTKGEGARTWVWMEIALVPDELGQLDLNRSTADDCKAWLANEIHRFPSFGPRSVGSVRPGFQCLDFSDAYDGASYSNSGRLNLDGTGVACFTYLGGEGDFGIPDDTSAVYDEYVVGDLINGVAALASHALRSGAAGYAHVAATLTSSTGLPMILAECRSQFPGPFRDARAVLSVGVSRHTVPLEPLGVPSGDQLVVARMLAADLFSAFGLPEVQQITADHALAKNRFLRGWQDYVTRWAEGAGVEMVPDM